MRMLIPLAVGSTIMLAGCLTVKQKEYKIQLHTDHSGDATITFVDIASASDDTVDISKDDFRQLIEFYIEGPGLENEYPGFRNVSKRLYEDHGLLHGEIRFEFDSLASLRLYRFDSLSPVMYYVGDEFSTERVIETNGVYGGEIMPVVFWPRGTQELTLKTHVVSEAQYRRSLLPHFRAWEQERKSRGSSLGPQRRQ